MRCRFLLILGVLAQAACGSGTVPTAPITADQAAISVFISTALGAALVGEVKQLTATVQFADRHLKTGATTQVGWSSSNEAVLTVSPSGLMRVVGPGVSDVTVTFQTVSGRAHVVAWPSGAVTFRGVVRSSAGTPVEGARVEVGSLETAFGAVETTSDAAGRFTVVTSQARAVSGAFAIHDDYEIGTVDVGPQHVVTGIDLVLAPFPDRVYLRERGDNVCAGRPRIADRGLVMATFAVHHSGPWDLIIVGRNSPFFDSYTIVSRDAPSGGRPIFYDRGQPLDAGYTYTWTETPDPFACAGRPYDLTIAHPR